MRATATAFVGEVSLVGFHGHPVSFSLSLSIHVSYIFIYYVSSATTCPRFHFWKRTFRRMFRVFVHSNRLVLFLLASSQLSEKEILSTKMDEGKRDPCVGFSSYDQTCLNREASRLNRRFSIPLIRGETFIITKRFYSITRSPERKYISSCRDIATYDKP